ncbi:hypothetical protein AVHY2522_19545 [Acidovorax sp. SUPP2522]|uniref:hypothetical protein n=1 Tax=unclassified Acidovorax TaxID=2684926 RepID=UPI00234A6598|nr:MULTISPECIES: hypothetical protein [unclassified Acidovorax]WCM97565.1 hypothetical protein M5C96_24810 [Acidovorax sp. GBBC 1281]GKT18629.1 hypothetical protein AVHY2522_19545 [Acidovorax sp. SUPP2522]
MLSRSTLSLLQQAGESLYAAQQAMAQEVQSGAQSVVNTVASLPFSAEADRAYAQLRTVARLSHELQAIEEQLRTAYQTAASLAQNDLQLLQALPLRRSPQISPGQQAQAEDAVVKPTPVKGVRASSKTKTKTQSSGVPNAQSLSSNDDKVLTYLERVLTRSAWSQMTQASIAEGAGIPKGSIAVAIHRLKQMGRLKEGARGQYRLK